MISVIITSFKEEKTVARAINVVGKQISKKDEIMVVAPDDGTLNEARKLTKKYKNLIVIKDTGKGKSLALNLAKSKAKGEILVLTDGDVYLAKEAVRRIVLPFEKNEIGAVSGRPVSVNPRSNKYGYWSYVLSEIANDRRIIAAKTGRKFFCSGYLFAIRKKLLVNLPEGLLSEDGYISNKVYDQGYSIAYAPGAVVYVKYPDNFSDWIKQKKRSAGGYNQIKKMTGVEMRSFKTESRGAGSLFRYVSGLKNVYWLISLFVARLYLWLTIYIDINIRKKSHRQVWLRVESTK